MIQLSIMAKEKRSFFERLTGTVKMSDENDPATEKGAKKALARGGNAELESWTRLFNKTVRQSEIDGVGLSKQAQ